MTEINALSLFQENPQSSDQKPHFRNSFAKKPQQFPCDDDIWVESLFLLTLSKKLQKNNLF